MSLEKDKRGDVNVLAPHKDLSGGEETRELERAIQGVIAEGVPKVVVDLGRVSYINSAGLGTLVALHTSCRNRQGYLRLSRIGKRIKNLFLITKLNFVFETFDSVEEALAGVNRSDQS
ncbi:MAG: STAS domain-containing protein [Candidatus Eisenbacteria bacterium]|nr:STAS domain-containing protein [Candidatus Eisenbacteria bacterium]